MFVKCFGLSRTIIKCCSAACRVMLISPFLTLIPSLWRLIPQTGPILVYATFDLTRSEIGLEQNNLFLTWWLW